MFKELNTMKIFLEEPNREFNIREASRILKIAPATASKELKEEVGLTMGSQVLCIDKLYNSPGITDESCSYVFCDTRGEITTKYNEASEDIEILVVNKEQAKELLNKEKFSAKCWLIVQAYASGLINGYDWII